MAGALPSRRYNRAWTTQRLLNRAPEWTRARTSPVSVAQQIANISALEIQDTEKALAHEKNNANLASCDLTLPEHIWKIELPPRFEFVETEDMDRSPHYGVPSVYGEIHNDSTQLTLAEENNIQTLFYEALPTRIEYGEQQVLWDYVIPTTEISQLVNVTPSTLPIEGPLYITLDKNTVWEEEFKRTLYRSQIHLSGTGLLGEEVEEVIALRMNGTYKTRTHWKTLDEVFVLHVSSNATITIASLPFADSEILNSREVSINNNGIEQYQFYELGEHAWGSTLVGKAFLVGEMDQVRMGLDKKTINMELELLDGDEQNIVANAMAFQPWTNYVYVVDDNYLYVYDYSLPFPNVENMVNDTGDNRMSILFPDNKWIYTRDDTVEIHTRILDLASIPVSNRWTITYPDGTRYRMGINGSLWPTTVDGWIINANYGDSQWAEQKIEFSELTQTGSYIIELETKYIQEDGEIIYRITKELVFVPVIQPETQLLLPVELRGSRNIGLDGEGKLWFYNGTSLFLAELFYDYFMVDYDRKTIWLREQYQSVRVVP